MYVKLMWHYFIYRNHIWRLPGWSYFQYSCVFYSHVLYSQQWWKLRLKGSTR